MTNQHGGPAATGQNPPAYDWAASRGEKWRAKLPGMEASLAPVDEPLISALRLDRPCRVAEVGCGGGGTALAIASRAPEGSEVHGFDIAPSLVELARGRVQPGDRAVSFEVADMSTAAPGEPYDRLASRFGVMFFADHASAFENLARWLRPGGRLAFAVWGPPAENVWYGTVREVVSSVVAMPPIDPEAPGPFRYAEAGRLLALLERAGIGELEVSDWRGALTIGGSLPPDEAARFALSGLANFGELLAQAGEGAFDTAHRALTERFSGAYRDGAVRLDAAVHIVTGARRG